MTAREFNAAHSLIVRAVPFAYAFSLEDPDRAIRVECSFWATAAWDLCESRGERLCSSWLTRRHCSAKLVAACRELNAGVMEDESTTFADLCYFQRNGVFNAVRFERIDDGKDGPERTEYRLRDVIAWMDIPPPPSIWFEHESVPQQPVAKEKALSHAERWEVEGRGIVRAFELTDGAYAVTLIGKGISAALFIGRDGFEWLRFRDDSEYYFGCNDADEWPIFWAWLATAPAGAKPASLAYELLPYDPIVEGM